MAEATASSSSSASLSPPQNAAESISANSLLGSRSVEEMQEEEDVLHKKLMIFGTDVGQIPCFRNSFLYGISGGIGLGIAHFAISSKIRNATRFGFWSYVGITAGYWCKCRYEYTMTKQEYARINYAMKHAVAKDGTKDALPRETAAP